MSADNVVSATKRETIMFILTINSQQVGSSEVRTDTINYDREVVAFCNFKEELQWESTLSASVTDSTGSVIYQENGSFH